MTETQRIPLFPLGVVLLPDMLLPLHIFEDRYKQMIAECLDEDKPFGIVLFDGQSIRSVGCSARVTSVLKHYDDGRMDIMTRGRKRFVVRELIEERAYMEARVLFFDDTTEDVPEESLDKLVATALDLLKEVVDVERVTPDSGGRIDPRQLAFAIAALDGFTPAERQGFLEMTSPSERLEKCNQALSRIVARSRLTQEIQRVIGGNGSPPKSILRELEEKQ